MAVEGTELQLAFGISVASLCLIAEVVSSSVTRGEREMAEATALYAAAKQSVQKLASRFYGDPAVLQIALSTLESFEQRIAGAAAGKP